MNLSYRHRVIDSDPLGDILNNCVLGDLFNRGETDMVIASGYDWARDPIMRDGYLYYYEGPELRTRRVIDTGQFQLGLLLHDLTGNGFPDIIAAHNFPPALYWYENPGAPGVPWQRHKIEDNLMHMYHDLLLADIDCDGRLELLASSPFFYLGYYDIPQDPRRESWKRNIICFRNQHEGLAAQDVRGTGMPDVMAGPWHYLNPGKNPPERWPRWDYRKITDAFRPWCRLAWMAFEDGRQGLVVTESEYPDGRLSWFEYDAPAGLWTEHPIDTGIYFGHTLRVAGVDRDGAPEIFVGEMHQGGYGAKRNDEARLMFYTCTDSARNAWERNVISQGVGTHEAHLAPCKGKDGLLVLGKRFYGRSVDLWEPI